MKKNIKFKLISRQFLGLSSGAFLGLILGINGGFLKGLLFGLIGGIIGTVFYGIIGPEIETKTYANQGIKQSFINIVNMGIFSFPFMVVLNITSQLFEEITINVNKALIFGIVAGVNVGIVYSGQPVIQHFILRLFLWSNGYIPWNYAKFLNYSTNRLFLQRIGGGYRFIHKMLQDHFAQMYMERK